MASSRAARRKDIRNDRAANTGRRHHLRHPVARFTGFSTSTLVAPRLSETSSLTKSHSAARSTARYAPSHRERLAGALAWYIAQGYIELVDWPDVRPVRQNRVDKDQWDHRHYHDQVLQYNHCLNAFRSTSHWMFNLDTDEIVDGRDGATIGASFGPGGRFENETAVELRAAKGCENPNFKPLLSPSLSPRFG